MSVSYVQDLISGPSRRRALTCQSLTRNHMPDHTMAAIGGPSNEANTQAAANTSHAQALEALRSFFNAWTFPPGSEPLQQAIRQLLQSFENCMSEKVVAVATLSTESKSSQVTVKPLYETDEEELHTETNWILQEKKQKKRTSGQQNANKKGKNWTRPEDRKPPPIFVDKPGKISSLTNIVNTEIGPENYTTKIVDNNKVKINLEDGESYRKTVQILQKENLMFHTYENKQTRPIRVMAKGLDYTTEPEEIIEYLTRKGFKIIKADAKFSAKEKKPLNMFILSFDNSENIDSIYRIPEILRQIVQICPMKGSKIIPQCKNCQEFSHTKNHCNKKPRCVKCAQGHLTAHCNKSSEARAKCANCGGDHPASYRGCMVARELQKRKNMQSKNIRASFLPSKQENIVRPPQGQKEPLRAVQRGVSYAKVVGSQTSQSDIQLILAGIKDLKIEILNMKERVEKIENRSKPGPKPKKS